MRDLAQPFSKVDFLKGLRCFAPLFLKVDSMEWKWTKGEPYERSRRIIKQDNGIVENEKFIKTVETSAYSSALLHDENTWDILNQELSNGTNNGGQMGMEMGLDASNGMNKREDLDFKIADRDMIQYGRNNPFLGQNNYVDDIAVRDRLLKPVNTSQEKEKEKKQGDE